MYSPLSCRARGRAASNATTKTRRHEDTKTRKIPGRFSSRLRSQRPARVLGEDRLREQLLDDDLVNILAVNLRLPASGSDGVKALTQVGLQRGVIVGAHEREDLLVPLFQSS